MDRSSKFLIWLVLASWGAACPAVEPQDLSIVQMLHASWTARDGAPQAINCLAQAPDGILWIGSGGGLFSFDGRSFTQFQPAQGDPPMPSVDVRSILIDRNGALWVGLYEGGVEGGVMQIKHGHSVLYAHADDVPLRTVTNIQQAPDGTLWAFANQQKLVRFGADGVWHTERGLPDSRGLRVEIFADSSNTLWVASNGVLFKKPPSAEFAATNIPVDMVPHMAEAPNGTLWLSDVEGKVDRGRLQHFDRSANALETLKDVPEADSLLVNPQDSSLWMALQDSQGIGRYQQADAPAISGLQRSDAYRKVDGLSSNVIRTFLVDTDGDVWAGGAEGLDRFSRPRFVPVPGLKASPRFSLCTGTQGETWVGTNSRALYKVMRSKTQLFSDAGDIYYLSCTKHGDVLFLDHLGIWRVHNDRIAAIPAAPSHFPFAEKQVLEAEDGTLYASYEGSFWVYKQGRWTQKASYQNARPFIEFLDSHDRLWAGYRDGQLDLPLNEEHPRIAPSPELGVVAAIVESTQGVLAGGMNGIAILRGKTLMTLTFEDSTIARGVSGIVESLDGDIWLNDARGVVRIPQHEVQEALKGAKYPMKADLMSEGEFAGPSPFILGGPTAAKDSEGRLWFILPEGVVWIDPQNPRPSSSLPLVSIRSIEWDAHPLDAERKIGPNPNTLVIRYFGVLLRAPEKVTYQYKLDGVDDGWQDAGSRTEAIYTRLRPGSYVFHVRASDGNGVWTSPVNAEPFSVRPSFVQSRAFLALCVATGLLIIWLIFRMRVHIITSAIRRSADERADERIRIARELHDTLLQGVQGLLLNFHVAAEKVAPDAQSRKILDKALATADRIIIEGRNRVNSLRSEHLTDQELTQSIQNVGNDLNSDGTAECSVRRTGITAVLRSGVVDEVFYIAREALTNTFRHASATRIDVTLVCGKRQFVLRCKDNGCGFGVGADTAAPNRGHWGLRGMAERAAKLGADFASHSAPGQGTEIVITLAAGRAYEPSSRAWPLWTPGSFRSYAARIRKKQSFRGGTREPTDC